MGVDVEWIRRIASSGKLIAAPQYVRTRICV